jgi:hypothetical protein
VAPAPPRAPRAIAVIGCLIVVFLAIGIAFALASGLLGAIAWLG